MLIALTIAFAIVTTIISIIFAIKVVKVVIKGAIKILPAVIWFMAIATIDLLLTGLMVIILI